MRKRKGNRKGKNSKERREFPLNVVTIEEREKEEIRK